MASEDAISIIGVSSLPQYGTKEYHRTDEYDECDHNRVIDSIVASGVDDSVLGLLGEVCSKDHIGSAARNYDIAGDLLVKRVVPSRECYP